MGIPYRLDPAAATILAQICCFNNELPQGAPTSPIVSNMVCAKMDSQLMGLAKANRSNYTRYADDITFSTNLREFPPALATTNAAGEIEVGTELGRIIRENGFEINPDKVRLRNRNRRQQVTGLITNRFPNVRRKYVRQIRAMLHAWEKYGLDAAEAEFLARYDRKHRSPWNKTPSFKRVVKGKIEFLGMVRGKHDPIYLGFCNQLRALAPELVKEPSYVATSTGAAMSALVFTEGTSDCDHLQAALKELQKQGCYSRLDIDFARDRTEWGAPALEKACKVLSSAPQAKTTICIFDRDDPEFVKRLSTEGKSYKKWGNKVFSFVLPVPGQRQDTPNISIEFYYKDSEIKREDRHGRRLFVSTEFDSDSARHRQQPNLNCTFLDKVRKPNAIIDSGVYDENSRSVALTKADFANYILKSEPGFDNFDFSEFRLIFDLIMAIVQESTGQ